MKFKLEYQISRQTEIELLDIIKKIQVELKEKGYRILTVTDRIVKFDNDPWMPRWNFSAIKLDKGGFEIISEADQKKLTLNYSISYLYQLILFAAATVFIIVGGYYLGIKEDYIQMLFFGGFLLLTVFINTIIAKEKASDMINEILGMKKTLDS